MAARVDAAERRRLRLRLGLFFVALAVPAALLLFKALDQLKWEALRQTQLAAEALTLGIDQRLEALIHDQDARSFADFAFLTLAGDPSAGFVQRSALSAYPVDAVLPGLIGWFQIDASGRLSTPLLPTAGTDVASYGIGADELARRQQVEQRIGAILGRNALLDRSAVSLPSPPTAEPMVGPTSDPASGPASEPMAEPLAKSTYDAASGPFPEARRRDDLDQSDGRLAAASAPAIDGAQSVQRQALFERLSPAPIGAMADSVTGAGLDAPARAGVGDHGASRSEALEVAARSTAASRALSAPEQHTKTVRSARREQAALPEMVAAAPPVRPDSLATAGAELQVAAMPSGPEAPAPNRAVRPTEDGQRSGRSAPDLDAVPDASPVAPRPVIRTFASELDPFRFSLLDSGHFVLFRWAWRDGARYVQGALIEPDAFLSTLIGDAFRASVLQSAVNLRMAWGERVLHSLVARSQRYDLSAARTLPAGTVVYRGQLTEPFGSLRLLFDAERLPMPAGATLVIWLGLSMGLVLVLGSWGLYRLGLRQLGLVRQQQDFVAAVSHELKTPLTSIRMYSEMLREGWVTDDKRDQYYRYIHDETERLSRLVANVLQLARMSRDALRVEPRPVHLSELLRRVTPALLSQARQAGFELLIDCVADGYVDADPDALTQVLINLVDNAVKFSAKSESNRIEIVCADAADGGLWLGVRDHGPGIPRAERRRVFELFHRLENESTRDTKGTGIGLALVERLMRAMHGRVELIDREPGVEARLWLPRSTLGPGQGTDTSARPPSGELERRESEPRTDFTTEPRMRAGPR